MKEIITTIFLLIVYSNGFCQPDTSIKCSINVVSIDSDYIAVPKLIITSKVKSIFISSNRYYEYGICKCSENPTDIDGIIYLQKEMLGTYANISVDMIRDKMFSDEKNSLQQYEIHAQLNDTLQLYRYYPLEVGNYRIRLSFYYFEENQRKEVSSDWTYFNVLYVSKNSLF